MTVTISDEERGLIGSIAVGKILEIFGWGIIVDLKLSKVGLIDVLYIDGDEGYTVGGACDWASGRF